jgi:PAS domain S-box-containing protein
VDDAREIIQAGLIGEALDDGPALVFVADDRMRYVAVNKLAAETLGYAREDLLGLSVTDVVRTGDATGEYREMMIEGARVGRATLTRKDGTTVGFSYRAARTRIAKLEFWVSVGFVDAE